MTGTDAYKVAEAITEVSSPEGVLVMMDLGSAVMSAEMALEFLEDPDVPVRLSSAPFVEGLMAAVVRAAGGAALADVEREARGALRAKQTHLGDEDPAGPPVDSGPAAEHVIEVRLLNPDGLHARPVSKLVTALSAHEATVTVANLRTGTPAPGAGEQPDCPVDRRCPEGRHDLRRRGADRDRGGIRSPRPPGQSDQGLGSGTGNSGGNGADGGGPGAAWCCR